MADATTKQSRAAFNLKQLVVKVIANSFYGITAARTGYLSCQRVGALTTQVGRDMIECVRKYAAGEDDGAAGEDDGAAVDAAMISAEGGCGHDDDWRRFKRQVVYGDTDSVFVKFIGATVEQAYAGAQGLCAHINTKLFPGVSEVSIVPDNLYDGLYIDQMKKYCGVAVANPSNAATSSRKLVFKGIDVVRRDAPAYIRAMLRVIFERMLPLGAGASRKAADTRLSIRDALCRMLDDMVDGNLPLRDFADCKTLKISYAKPDAVAHACVAKRHNKLVFSGVLGGAPLMCGDNVAYVRTERGGHKALMRDCASSVAEVEASKGKQQVDMGYYVKRLESACEAYLASHVPTWARYIAHAAMIVSCKRTSRVTANWFGAQPTVDGAGHGGHEDEDDEDDEDEDEDNDGFAVVVARVVAELPTHVLPPHATPIRLPATNTRLNATTVDEAQAGEMQDDGNGRDLIVKPSIAPGNNLACLANCVAGLPRYQIRPTYL